MLAAASFAFVKADSGDFFFPCPTPVTDKPVVSVLAPSSNVSVLWGNGQLVVSFSVAIPESWAHDYTSGLPWDYGYRRNFIGAISSITCSLDQTQIVHDNTSYGYPNFPTAYLISYQKVVGSLSPGQHTLTISVRAYTVYMLQPNYPINYSLLQYYDASATLTYAFTAELSPTTTPLPTLTPTATPSPTPNPSPTTSSSAIPSVSAVPSASIPEFPTSTALPLILVVISIIGATVAQRRKRRLN